MPPRTEHRYELLVLQSSGTRVLSRVEIAPDWDPLAQSAVLEHLRQLGRFPSAAALQTTSVNPVWNAKAGEPYVAAVRAELKDASSGDGAFVDAPLEYFSRFAEQAALQLVQMGRLHGGEQFRYVILAHREDEDSGKSPHGTAQEIPPRIRIHQTDLSSLDTGFVNGRQARRAPEIPLFIHADVIAETAALSLEAGDTETGGLLIGKLHHDAALPEAFVEITGHIPAEHANGQQARLEFTPDTFASARAVIRRRGGDEFAAGWFHSHPFHLCEGCRSGAEHVCSLERFSAADVTVHRSLFSSAWGVGLLLNTQGDGRVRHSMFGWRGGLIERRSFRLLGACK